MAAFREVSVRLADGSTEVGYFKERQLPEPSSLEIGVEVKVGQRVSFIGSNAEYEVKNASWQRMAAWCHADLVPPTPRRLTGPTPEPVVAPIATTTAAPEPEPLAAEEPEITADEVDQTLEEGATSDE